MLSKISKTLVRSARANQVTLHNHKTYLFFLQ